MDTPARLEEGQQPPPNATSQHRINPRDSGAYQDPTQSGTRRSNTVCTSCYKDVDIINAPLYGWPYVAATQFYYRNFSIHRSFKYLRHRCLLDQESKIAYLEKRLKDLDKSDKENNTGRLTSLPFDPDTLLFGHTRAQAYFQSTSIPTPPTTSKVDDRQQGERDQYSPWQDKDLVMEAIKKECYSYMKFILHDQEMEKLSHVSAKTHKAFHREVAEYSRLDESASQFLHSEEDFVSTYTDQAHQYFEGLLYKDKSPDDADVPDHNTQDTNYIRGINNQIFVIILKTLVVFVSGGLLICPMAILFLVNLSRVWSFVVVVFFNFAFGAVLVYQNYKLETILVGLSAYMAVLVTFLSNLQQGMA
ncbi:hypothetical protein F5Y11DRAFT_213877 [Daldinia sp. FL1419]|nr:hypothetical protein F5Y11DRAFT_213877 [Daldinia sp. FL1419]